MIKIVNLGAIFPETGETRVRIIDTELLKTASNEIQTFWDTLSPNNEKAYLHVIAMSAWEYYGPNNNGDSFYEHDLVKYHPSFVKDGNIFLHHVNKDPKKSAGKPIYSFYNDNMHRVELVLAVDKLSPNSREVLRRLNAGEQIYVSMGVHIKFDVCSICKNEAKTRADYCEHLRYNMRRILEDGRQVHAFNPGPLKFFDISVVNKCADQTAWALKKIASRTEYISYSNEPTSAELGEISARYQEKSAAISKLADMLKQVDGDVIDVKDSNTPNRCEMLKKIRENKKSINWPNLETSTLMDKSVTPGGMLTAIITSGGMPSLFESAHISGRHYLGDDFIPRMHVPMMVRMMPRILGMMNRNPNVISKCLGEIFSGYENYPDEITIKIVPVVQRRIRLVRQMIPDSVIIKQAEDASYFLEDFKIAPPPPRSYESIKDMLIYGILQEQESNGPANMDNFHVVGKDGKIYRTSRYNAENALAKQHHKLVAAKILGAALGLASIGAAASDMKTSKRALLAPALAMAALKFLTIKPKDKKVKSMEGHEIPASAAFENAARKVSRDYAKYASEFCPTDPLIVGFEYSIF